MWQDMHQAFHYIDVDNSGRVNKKEILRALDLWNIPMAEEDIDQIIAKCDDTGDGEIDYTEFVDHLARDTVAPAALGKHGLQPKEATLFCHRSCVVGGKPKEGDKVSFTIVYEKALPDDASKREFAKQVQKLDQPTRPLVNTAAAQTEEDGSGDDDESDDDDGAQPQRYRAIVT